LVWRELSYHWCFHKFPRHDAFEALPAWASGTLLKHVNDERGWKATYEQLCGAQSPDRLWNVCQLSLNWSGELHNNVRMTWGKRFVEWCDGPQQALLWALDLNHRYALDGMNPSGVAGVLWCFGQFDSKGGEKPISGSLKQRSSAKHNGVLAAFESAIRSQRPVALCQPLPTPTL
jgi:deoxyribodipyrimidine photolyase